MNLKVKKRNTSSILQDFRSEVVTRENISVTQIESSSRIFDSICANSNIYQMVKVTQIFQISFKTLALLKILAILSFI